MDSEIKCPDVETVLESLKPFQRDTVEYVFNRLYGENQTTSRFLVADEVGLGKTLVARGVIAKATRHLWNQVGRIDVVYICSNADIARQNINRLNITGRKDFAHASRITLLPLSLKSLNRKLNFVSFTPGTSFNLKSSLGIWEERRLLYWLLKDGWNLHEIHALNVLQGDVGDYQDWRNRVRNFEGGKQLPSEIIEAFLNDLEGHIQSEKQKGLPDIRLRFEKLCDRFRSGYYRYHNRIPQEDVAERNGVIGELRSILAKTCLKSLEPDIVVLDEFQRFKELLAGESEASQLAQELFSYSDKTAAVRTLMLSATPYKMYTLYEESAEEDHYEDFLKTLSFLENDPVRTNRFKDLLKAYRRELYRFGSGNWKRLLTRKVELERALRRVMVRTERSAAAGSSDDMVEEVPSSLLNLSVQETAGFLGLQKLARDLDQGDVVEYWKSAPFLLNFMDHYQLKQKFKGEIENGGAVAMSQALSKAPGITLPWEEIKSYNEIDPRNARLRQLTEDTVGQGTWQLLWLPPSISYYELAGPFAEIDARCLTKRLVFSSWDVVPKVISAMVSYEAERQMFRSFEEAPENTAEARKKHAPLLRFALKENRLSGMPTLALLYPSLTLAACGDPLEIARKLAMEITWPPSLSDVLDEAERRIRPRLEALSAEFDETNRSDEAWYWAAPILLDGKNHPEEISAWFAQPGLSNIWAGDEWQADSEDKESRWHDHVEYARAVLEGRERLGTPPEDLPRVLAWMAVAGPAVTALRSLSRAVEGDAFLESVIQQNQAARIAWSFRKLFNQPEVMALLRGMKRRQPYWRMVLEYCAEGGLQAVLDEYTHILREFLGVATLPSEDAIKSIAKAVSRGLSLKTSRTEMDEIRYGEGDVSLQRHSMRGHFALRFGQQKSEGGGETTREDQVRDAFNSPFWPFVLASTSVGQEGLDFHPYCHAVVHWNLPPNPVDMEQREGRVHRYKGHAVRKNLVSFYQQEFFVNTDSDPWAALFAKAIQDYGESSRGLVPCWSFPIEGGSRVERHVPAFPLSRDEQKLHALRRSLAVYRMVFGQARQEDLVELLLSRLPEDEVPRFAKALQIRLAPPPFERRAVHTHLPEGEIVSPRL